MSAVAASKTRSAPTNHIGPLGHGPVVTIRVQKAVKSAVPPLCRYEA
jgi:hypothetical protein